MIDLDFEGERLVPGKVEPELELEHFARYRFAGHLVQGAHVLDFGCGAGYGAVILKRAGARSVVGSDRSPAAIWYASHHYAHQGVRYCVTNCERSAFATDRFDAVVSFELIEHLQNYHGFVREVRRVLKPGGRFIVSTPNKRTYTDERKGEPNPFHIHEFYLDELRDVLARQFPVVTILGQSLTEGTLFHAERPRGDAADHAALRMPVVGARGEQAMVNADFFVAICAQEGDPLIALDATELFHVEETNALRARKRRIFDLQAELEQRTRWAKDLENESSRRGRRILELQEELTSRTTWAQDLAQEGEARARRILELQGELEERLRWGNQLEREREDRDQRIIELKSELAMLSDSAQRLAEVRLEVQQRTEAIERDIQKQLSVLGERGNEHVNALALQRAQWDEASHRLTALTDELTRLEETTHHTAGSLDQQLIAIRGLVRWQRDTLIHHQDDIERHDTSLDRLDDLLGQVRAQVQHHDTTLATMRQAAANHEAMLERHSDRLTAMAEHMQTAYKQTHDQADIMWNSLPWRLWAKLGRMLDALPWRRRTATLDAAAEALSETPTDEANAAIVAAASGATARALVLDHRVPTPKHDAGSVRMMALLEVLKDQGYAVTFLPANLYAWEPYYSELLATGVEIITTAEYPSLDAYLEAHGASFELAFVARLHIAKDHIAAVRAACQNGLVIFDTVDLQYLRLERQAALEGDEAKRAEAETVRETELAVARQADITLVVSDAEQRMLRELAPDLDVRVVSLIHDIAPFDTPLDARQDFYFIGGFEHPPNLDAATWFVNEIFPTVRAALPEVRVRLIGSKAPPALQSLAGNGVEIVGYVDDVDPYLAGSRLSIAPLRYGAGVKGKVTQSLAAGLPCVMTSVAAEGMGLVDQHDALIADDAPAFAHAVITLYRDDDLWRRLATEGVQRMQERFSRTVAEQNVRGLVEHARSRSHGHA